MSASDWRPAPLPPSLVGHAKRCPQCLPVREVVIELITLLADAHRPEAKLTHRNEQIQGSDLDVKCGWCKDTGWILDDSLKELVRRARDLVDARPSPAADKPEQIPLARPSGAEVKDTGRKSMK